jgi:hypothetical protein
MAIGDVISAFGPWIGIIVIGMAIFSYLLAQYYQRKVFPRVEYHRLGPNSETYHCVEVGNRVMFRTGGAGMSLFKKAPKSLITAIIKTQPEVKVFGFRTIRLHHVLEGFNQTVDIRDLVRKNIIDPLGGGALATSEAVMATSFEAMSKSIPKTKMDFMMNILMIALGFGWGILMGVVFG